MIIKWQRKRTHFGSNEKGQSENEAFHTEDTALHKMFTNLVAKEEN